MTTYMSYYTFFSDNIKIIKDIRADFTAEGTSGNSFDKDYNSFLNKFVSRCRTFAGETFKGSSKVISNYISAIGDTKALPQNQRFDKLIGITDSYMRTVM